jgi:ketosteroid isomerase-like protein
VPTHVAALRRTGEQELKKVVEGVYAEVVQVIHRLALAADSGDVDALLDCYDDDIVIKYVIAGAEHPSVAGKAALRERNTSFFSSQRDARRHYTTNSFIEEATDDDVVLRSYLLLVVIEDGEIRIQTTGMYRDVLRKRRGRWRVCERAMTLDFPY